MKKRRLMKKSSSKRMFKKGMGKKKVNYKRLPTRGGFRL